MEVRSSSVDVDCNPLLESDNDYRKGRDKGAL